MIDNNVDIKIISQKNLINSKCFNYNKAIKVCEQSFIEYRNDNNIIIPNKTSVIFDEKSQNRINCLPAGIKNKNIYGMKWISVFPNNPLEINIPNISAVILLSSMKSGLPLALMDGTLCSNMRTSCVAALATKYLSKKSSTTIGFVGAGEQAKASFLAIMSVRKKINKCYVSSRTNKSEKKFISDMKKFYPEIKFIECKSDYSKAVKEADIIVSAISGQETIIKADWIKEGSLYCHIAGLEDEYKVAKKADKIICDNWEATKHRTQTISRMYKEGLIKDKDIYADLDEIISKEKIGRENDKEFIYFNSVGMAFADIVLASWMYEKCIKTKEYTITNLKNESMFNVDIDKFHK